MLILPARLRGAHLRHPAPSSPVLPLRPGRFGVVFAGRSARPAAPARTYDPAAVFGSHRPPAPRRDFDDDTIVCEPWWL